LNPVTAATTLKRTASPSQTSQFTNGRTRACQSSAIVIVVRSFVALASSSLQSTSLT
jgi:hypothetical protein